MDPTDPHYWERREDVGRMGASFKIDPSRWGHAGFWDLFEAEANHWITSQPVADVIPLLRCLIDKYWDLGEDDFPLLTSLITFIACFITLGIAPGRPKAYGVGCAKWRCGCSRAPEGMHNAIL
jgi:hypothetical protein